MSFRLIPKLVTLNDLKRRNGLYFALLCGSFRGALRKNGWRCRRKKFTFASSSPDEFLVHTAVRIEKRRRRVSLERHESSSWLFSSLLSASFIAYLLNINTLQRIIAFTFTFPFGVDNFAKRWGRIQISPMRILNVTKGHENETLLAVLTNLKRVCMFTRYDCRSV